MRKVRLVVDSCSDIEKNLREEHGILWAKNYIRFEDGRELPADINWELYSPRELYDYMRGKKRISSYQVGVPEFERVFTECGERGEDVVYVGCSSALSGSVNAAVIAKNNLSAKFPEMKIAVVDTLRASVAVEAIATDAARLVEQGKSAEEVETYLNENKLNYHMIGTIDSLEYLKRAGRVKASAAFFGNLFGVKPVIIADAKGNNFAVKKIRGRQTALKELVAMAKEEITDAKNQCVYVGHADCIEDAEFLKAEIEKEISPESVRIDYIGPCVGSSTGPGMIALFFKGKKVTQNEG